MYTFQATHRETCLCPQHSYSMLYLRAFNRYTQPPGQQCQQAQLLCPPLWHLTLRSSTNPLPCQGSKEPAGYGYLHLRVKQFIAITRSLPVRTTQMILPYSFPFIPTSLADYIWHQSLCSTMALPPSLLSKGGC